VNIAQIQLDVADNGSANNREKLVFLSPAAAGNRPRTIGFYSLRRIGFFRKRPTIAETAEF
jgi:hypothetical protein